MGDPSTSMGRDLLPASHVRCAAYRVSRELPRAESNSRMLYRSRGLSRAALSTQSAVLPGLLDGGHWRRYVISCQFLVAHKG